MDEIERIIRKNKLKREQYVGGDKDAVKEELPKKWKYVKGLISRSLIAIIFVLGSIISLIIGLFLGKIFNKVGLFLCLCFSLNLMVVNYLNRRKDGK